MNIPTHVYTITKNFVLNNIRFIFVFSIKIQLDIFQFIINWLYLINYTVCLLTNSTVFWLEIILVLQ